MAAIKPFDWTDGVAPITFGGNGRGQLRTDAEPKERVMSIRGIFIAASSALAVAGAAQADNMPTIASRSINLGEVSGTAYYTVEEEGFHVVATLAQGETGMPVRFEAMLSPGESMMLSTPEFGSIGPARVEISREGDQLLVRDTAVMN
jgi:hypothetical protein